MLAMPIITVPGGMTNTMLLSVRLLRPLKQSRGFGREYSGGYVAVNPTKKAVTITLPGSYERINGNQDKPTNNGQVVDR